MSDEKPSIREILKLVAMVLVPSFRANPGITILSALEALGIVAGALNPVFIGLLTVAVITGRTDRFIIGVCGLLGATGLNFLLQLTGATARLRQRQIVGFAFDKEITALTATIPTLDHMEAAEYLDKVQALRDNAMALGDAFSAVINFLNSIVAAATATVIAAIADPRLLLLLIGSIPPLLVQPMFNKWAMAAEESSAQPARLARDLMERATATGPGAEIRVFGLRDVLRERMRDAAYRWRTPYVGLAVRMELTNGSLALLYFLPALGILGWMLGDLLAGRISIWSFTVGVTSIGAMQRFATTIVDSATWTTQSVRVGARFLWLKSYAEKIRARHVGRTPPPAKLRTGIRLDHVSLRYHGAEVNALTDLDLTLPAGSVVAIVGENGAGKSTLANLLMGMYQPTAGRIMIDDCDLADLDIEAWRRQVTGTFQDHANLEFCARTAIGAGDLEHRTDDDRIQTALRTAAADDILAALPQGLDTQLGVEWPGGVGLSGGQWQRIALARGMMRPHPLLLILDEPTSALDAAAEDALFSRYAAAAAETSSRGGVTVLITHRFSTVSAADLVVVLVKGRVAEAGTHAELMAAQSAYAELYGLQAKGYR